MAAQPIAWFEMSHPESSDRPKPLWAQTKKQEYFQGAGIALPAIALPEDWLVRSGVVNFQGGLNLFGGQIVKNPLPVVTEIDRLKGGVEDEVIPSDFAYRTARSIVESAYGRLMQRKNPTIVRDPFLVTTDDDGGIRLAWQSGTRHLRANFGTDAYSQTYLYFQSDDMHDVEELSAERLAGRLAWLTES